jgi:hypothetical protein
VPGATTRQVRRRRFCLPAYSFRVTDPTPDRPATVRPVQYKGEALDADRGPGLGCFRFQLVVLAALIVLTPLSAAWEWPQWISATLLIAVVVLLLVAGQTIIFLLRLVAADRRAGRRRPMASRSRTVGELEDTSPDAAPPPRDDDRSDPPDEGRVRQ